MREDEVRAVSDDGIAKDALRRRRVLGRPKTQQIDHHSRRSSDLSVDIVLGYY